MHFGVDYHPEQWVFPYGGTAETPESAWERDVQLMQQSGVSVVRMGEFVGGFLSRRRINLSLIGFGA
jgi:beta-galactosidase GanA